MDNKVLKNIKKNYKCIKCHYECARKDVMDKHLMTTKHKNVTNEDVQLSHRGNEKFETTNKETKKLYHCVCGKMYKFKSGMSRHKLICKFFQNENLQLTGNNEIILQILEDNKELKKSNEEFKNLLVEQNKKINNLAENNTNTQNNIQNNTQHIQNNTQQNNITFNLNYFLNEKCKNAINMSDFIESMETSFQDLENTGKNGLVKSISQYITRELSKLDICDRPIHCSDLRRKILHIKERDEWQKDTDEQKHTKNSIRKINHKMNVLQIPKWLSANPNSNISDHSLNEVYLNIVSNTMDCEDKIHDIITNISDMLVIDKKKSTNMMVLTN